MFVHDFSSTYKLLKGIRDFPSGPVVKNTLANAGDIGLIPAAGSQEATEPMCQNYLACTVGPTCLNYWAYMPQLLKSECSRAHVLQQELECKCTAHWTGEKPVCGNEGPG